MAIFDTDYASEPHTCVKDTDLSEDTKERHMKTGLRDKAKKTAGYQWRSPDIGNKKYLSALEKLT